MRGLAALLFALSSVSIRADEILVFAAASLTESLQEIGRAYERKNGTAVRFSFGASSDLARQVQAGAPADVFFSADTARMDALEKSGFVRHEDRRELLSNQLVVVVPTTSSFRMSGPRDLLGLSRIAVADPAAAPAGMYARKWLESAGVWKEIEPRVVPTLDVRAALAAVESESVPAGIVYATDARTSKKVRPVFQTTLDPPILYSVSCLVRSGKRTVAAAAFVEFLRGSEAVAAFERAGFVIVRKE